MDMGETQNIPGAASQSVVQKARTSTLLKSQEEQFARFFKVDEEKKEVEEENADDD